MRKILIVSLLGAAVGLAFWLIRRGDTHSRAVATAANETRGQSSGPRADPYVPDSAPGVQSVPNLAATPSQSVVPNDRKHPGYDPTRLARVTSSSLSTIFQSEVRDPTWAAQREAAMRPLIERDFELTGVDAKLAKAECRYSTCELTFSSRDPESVRQASRVLQYGMLGGAFEPGGFNFHKGTAYFRARIAFETVDRDSDTWQRNYKERRKQRLELLRQAGVPPGYPPLPRE